MKIFGTDMDCITEAAVILVVIFHTASTNDEGVDRHCESFNCSDFSNQTLVIREDVTGDPYCIINKNTAIGEDVSCASEATATLLTPFYLLVQSAGEGSGCSLILEYGRDHEPGKTCFSEKDACPTPPAAVTSNVTRKDPKHVFYIVLGVISVVLVLVLAVLKRVGKNMSFQVAKEKQHPVPPADAIFSV
ncbi:uncharacterized protein LOC143933455 [Lithobates pipiens]